MDDLKKKLCSPQADFKVHARPTRLCSRKWPYRIDIGCLTGWDFIHFAFQRLSQPKHDGVITFYIWYSYRAHGQSVDRSLSDFHSAIWLHPSLQTAQSLRSCGGWTWTALFKSRHKFSIQLTSGFWLGPHQNIPVVFFKPLLCSSCCMLWIVVLLENKSRPKFSRRQNRIPSGFTFIPRSMPHLPHSGGGVWCSCAVFGVSQTQRLFRWSESSVLASSDHRTFFQLTNMPFG